MKVEFGAGVNVPTHVFAQLKGNFKKKVVLPKMAKRNTRGPFLFKCCRVVYNEETNRLELAKGEFVGKAVHRDVDDEDEEQDEYDNTAISLEESEQSNLAGRINRYRHLQQQRTSKQQTQIQRNN